MIHAYPVDAHMKKKQRMTFQQRQNAARDRAEQTRKQQCPECGALRPSLRGNPGEYGRCTKCGC